MTASTEQLWTAAEAAAATGGTLSGGAGWAASGVAIDSRALAPGDLFVALKDQRDGHDFVPAAFAAGACAALVSRSVEAGPELIVDDVLEGLRALGRAARDRSPAIRVAVTGSVGKTGVKEALRAVFAAAGRAHASERSYNNHWGAPLTLARMPRDTQRAVFELGMNHVGELTALSALVRPHVAAVTKIAPAHMAFFSSLAAVAEAKAEIFTGMESGGAAVIPAETPHADILALRAGQAGARIVTFGSGAGADSRVLDWRCDESGGEGEIDVLGTRLRVRLPISGAHWADNAACVLACAVLADVPPEAAAGALARFSIPQGRGGAAPAQLAGVQITLIDDAYNANPASMAAALAALGMRAPGEGGRRIAVLGDMLELGDAARDYHAALAGDVERARIDLVIAAGDLMGALWAALPPERRGARAANSNEAIAALKDIVRSGDVVLVKGSNASGMGRVAEALKRGAA
jgi:UDP-N-acetylmuramoyl-tripeptide--D-alanyl-D-alanine ligase